jgi:hypothetical protein
MVGSWRRIGQSAMDLVVFYSPEKETITYYINNDSAGYKIEYPFSYIKSITLDNGDPTSSAEGASQQSGGLIVELMRPPHFYMDSSGSGGFYEVGDFTEEQQASKVMIHYLGGQGKVLSGQLARLIQLEPYQNRHRREFTMAQDPKIAMHRSPMGPPQSPAMITPIHRPASQPNHFMDDSQLNVFHGTPVGIEAGLQPPRGHKRQRSRSVPVAIDWSMLRGPMPNFLTQPPPPSPSPFAAGSEIVAPIPMYGHHHGMQHGQMPLTIDTSASFPIDLRQYPMSATTAPSPSDFGTPAFFSGPGQDSMSTSEMATPFSMSLMSPIPDATAGPQMSMASIGGQDPVIANQSPPMTSLGQDPNETDMYHIGPDGSMLGDDGMGLQAFEWDTKHPIMTLPMRPNGMIMEEQQNQHSPGPVSYLDPANLNNSNQM